MYKLTLSKEHSGKPVQHFSNVKSNIDRWRDDLLALYPDETVKVYEVEEKLIEVHKGVKA